MRACTSAVGDVNGIRYAAQRCDVGQQRRRIGREWRRCFRGHNEGAGTEQLFECAAGETRFVGNIHGHRRLPFPIDAKD